MTQVLQIADRKDTLAAIFLELIEQILGIDAGNERPLSRQRSRYIGEPVVQTRGLWIAAFLPA